MTKTHELKWIIFLNCTCGHRSEHHVEAGWDRYRGKIELTRDPAIKLKCPACRRIRMVNSPMTKHPGLLLLDGLMLTDSDAKRRLADLDDAEHTVIEGEGTVR